MEDKIYSFLIIMDFGIKFLIIITGGTYIKIKKGKHETIKQC